MTEQPVQPPTEQEFLGNPSTPQESQSRSSANVRCAHPKLLPPVETELRRLFDVVVEAEKDAIRAKGVAEEAEDNFNEALAEESRLENILTRARAELLKYASQGAQA